MKDRFVNLAAGISLLFAVGVGMLWARSYWRYEGIWREGGPTVRSLRSFQGRLNYTSRTGFERGPLAWTYRAFNIQAAGMFQPKVAPTTWYGKLGFGSTEQPIGSAVPGAVGRDVYVLVPHWFALAILLVLPVAKTLPWLRRRRKQARGFEVVPANSGVTPTIADE